jgi:hypothetical protein
MEELLGKKIIKIDVNRSDSDEIIFYLSNGAIYKQCHVQDCCESVVVEDIDGDLDDLVGYPLLKCEEVYQDDINAPESSTWTFYKMATVKGYVTIRWYGSSNGYYSEVAQFKQFKDNKGEYVYN